MTIRVTVKSEEVLKKLKEIGSKAEKIVGKALEESAEIIRKEASDKAPRRRGYLAKGITVSEVKDRTIDIGPDEKSFYGRFLEFGTVKMSARPFLRPALDTKRSQVKAKFIEVIKGLIK